MIKRVVFFFCSLLLILPLAACQTQEKKPKIGVSFGVGAATRWEKEIVYMQERAKLLGADIEVRLNRTDTPKTQLEDCMEMIDSGIDVLIYTPRDATKAQEVLAYAAKKHVPVINYARVVLKQDVDLFVGYDSKRIGQKMGQYLVEVVYKGDYIVLRGDVADNNSNLLYEGAMRYIAPLQGEINIVLDAAVPAWSPVEAKKIVKEAVQANNNKIDAIFAPNDALAGASREALDELGITTPVAITGMDAELPAVSRVLHGTQSMTIFMDLKELAYTAVDEAVHFAKNEKINVNTEFDNGGIAPIKANLITGQLLTKENIEKVLLESGYLTRDELKNLAN